MFHIFHAKKLKYTALKSTELAKPILQAWWATSVQVLVVGCARFGGCRLQASVLAPLESNASAGSLDCRVLYVGLPLGMSPQPAIPCADLMFVFLNHAWTTLFRSHGSSQSPHRGQLPLLTFMCEVIKLGHELFGQLNKGSSSDLRQTHACIPALVPALLCQASHARHVGIRGCTLARQNGSFGRLW